jgi:glutamate--cysteine ligase catalytic subunit
MYNDTKVSLNRWARKYLKTEGKKMELELDKKLLNHYSLLFIRDNLCVFRGTIEKEVNLEETKLFEAIQSSNWNDVRLKPPPSMDSPIGWRVEFRSMDVQLTPELTFLFNHAVLVLSRILIHMRDKLNFYIPISKTDENFRRANLRNAAIEQKFFFRTNVFDSGLPLIEELTIHEIFAGKQVAGG